MATKKKDTKATDETPAPLLYTVTTETDKNGASVTIVEGHTYASNNSTVTVRAGERSYHGGTTVNGEFRCVMPATEEPITVYVDGELIA